MIDGFTLADAVLTLANEGIYDLPVRFEVRIPRDVAASELKTALAFIIPTSEAVAGFTRTDSDDQFTVEIGLQKQLDSGPDFAGEVRNLHRVIQQIRAQLERARITDAESNVWRCVELGIDPVFSADHILEQNLFTSVIQTTWRLI